MTARGVQNIPLNRVPKEWSAEWFARWTREVLVNVDIRNAIEGPGIQITGQPDTPATLTASADVLALINQPYVLATSSAFLPNERILAGQSGIVSVTDGGAGANITVGLELGGITPIYLEQEPGWSVMGRVPNATGYLQPITAALDGDVLRVAGDFLGFGDIVLRVSNFANPSAAVGLTAVNGSAITAMRSDGAPALDVSISPTWSGTHTFSITPVVPNDSWTYAKIQNVSATSRFLGRITSGAGDIEELTGTQATTLLDAFTSALKGLAPASGGGTTNFLRADGTWAAPGGGASGANPTASVGLAAVNGSASTFLRSDGAPALDQSIEPTWTGQHTFTGTLSTLTTNAFRIGLLSGISPTLLAYGDASLPSNQKSWSLGFNDVAVGAYALIAHDDAGNPAAYAMRATRSGTTITGFEIHAGGSLKVAVTQDGRLYGTALHNVGTVTGTTNQYVASGTYTPTLNNTTNVSGSTAYLCQWMRVGNVVTVSGRFDVTVTVPGAVATVLGMSLPIASAFSGASFNQLGGVACSDSATAGGFRGLSDGTNDRVVWNAGIAVSAAYGFTFTYVVV